MGGARRILWTAALFFICHSSLWAQNRIEWVSSWPEAQALAVKHQRLVLVHFWRPSCIACQKLERSVFNQPEFIRAVYTNYVAMSVNLAENPDAGRHFGVQQTPTDIVLAVDGKELYRNACPADLGRYIGVLDETAANARVNMPTAPPGLESTAATAPAQASATSHAAPANRGGGGSEFPLPSAGSSGAPGRTVNPEYVTNQWAAPAGNNVAPPLPEQRASYTAEYGGEFRPSTASNTAGPVAPAAPPAAGPPTAAPSTANQFPLPNRPVSSLGPPTGATRTVEPPVYETASTMPYRGAANASVPTAADQLSPSSAAGAGVRPANGLGAPSAPNQPAIESGSPLPPTAGSQQNPPLGLDGFCPVTLVEREEWVKGDPKFGAHHRGRTYLFVNAEAQAKFLQDRGFEKYAPALSGYDPVKYAERGELVVGNRRHGVFFHGQVFLFSDEAGLQQFWADPNRYATIVRAEHERSAMRMNTQR